MKTLLILVLLCCYSFTYGQNVSPNRAAQRAYDQANKFISDKSYTQAIDQLKQAANLDADFTAAWQQLGDLYRRQQNYAFAKDSYKKVLAINPEFYPLTYFGLGESELNTGDYEQALQHFRKYASYPNLPEENRKLLVRYIANCEFSLKAIQNPVPFKPVNMGAGINTKDQEYLPVLTADQETLIFTRQVNMNEDFFKSIKKNGKWDMSVYLSKNINTAQYNEGAQYLSPDGLYLFFTGCNRPDGLGRCDIYVSKREGKEWSKPFNIGPPINSEGWESQPSLSADGRTLYFTSTRPGGIGGYDIWKADLKNDGSWTNPVNLGPNINTPYNDQSPYIHPDGLTLYFSSDGWPGMGNKDIYISRIDTSVNLSGAQMRWQKPENLGYPINTFGEETGMTISNNGQVAFFASDQPGGFGGLDIYSFELPAHIRPKPVTYVKGRVFDKKTNEPLNAKIHVISLNSGKIIYDDLADESGEFLVTLAAGQNVAFNVNKEDYLFYSENFSLSKPNSTDNHFNLSIPLQKVEAGGMVTLKNIFFNNNQYELLPESKTELQQLISFLNSNPRVTIEIQGHTDNIGDEQSNQLLSENRAKAVYNYLIARKINPERLNAKGYGEIKSIGDNASEEGRQKNRRTEFLILKSN